MAGEIDLIRQMVRDFGAREIRPQARAWDAEARFPAEAIAALGELGLLGIEVPEEHGGAGFGAVESAVVMEELAAQDGSVALAVAAHNGLACGHILTLGTAEQQAELLPELASGERLGAWALSEAGAGSDIAALETRAVRQGDGWVLTGHKVGVTLGAVAGLCVVFARTGDGDDGVTAFAVDTQTDGWRVERTLDRHGMRAAAAADVALDGVFVPDGRVLGAVGAGLRDAVRLNATACIHIGAIAVGLARGALEEAVRYGTERQQFGRPITDFQMIQWKLADGATAIDGARLLVERAAGLRAAGREFAHEAAMARLFATEMAPRVCSDAIQVHGGYGYTTEFPVERAWRDARMCTLEEGTTELLRVRVARGVLPA